MKRDTNLITTALFTLITMVPVYAQQPVHPSDIDSDPSTQTMIAQTMFTQRKQIQQSPIRRPTDRLGEINSERSGGGRLQVGNDVEKLNRAVIALHSNGDGEVRVISGIPFSFTGRWSSTSGDYIDFVIENGFGNAGARGRGRIYINDRNQLERLELEGNSQGKRFNISFDTQREERPERNRDAGRLREINTVGFGNGSLKTGSRNFQPIERVAIILKRDGSAELRMFHRGSSTVLTGEWSESTPDTIDLNINSGLGDRTRGTGKLFLKGSDFDRLQLSGSTGRDNFTVNFISQQNKLREINTTARGGGNLRIGRNNDERISGISVILRRNGEAELRILSRDPITLKGRWSDAPNNTVDLTFDGSDSYGMRGRGRIVLKAGGDISHIEIDGNTARDRVNLDFNSN